MCVVCVFCFLYLKSSWLEMNGTLSRSDKINKIMSIQRSRSNDFSSDSDSDQDDLYRYTEKLHRERRGSRQSEESTSPETSPETTPNDDIPLLTQNKSRHETSTTSTIRSLDLAITTAINKRIKPKSLNNNDNNNNNHNIAEPTFNTLDLSETIINDVYDSLCSWDETEIDIKDRFKMNVNQFKEFFDKYIYSTVCLVDDDEVETLDKNKTIIAEAIFYFLPRSNMEEIGFKQFVTQISKLQKHEFVKALNVYDTRNKKQESLSSLSINTDTTTNNNNLLQSPLESIYEHSPLIVEHKSYDELNGDFSNKIELIENIRNQFLNNNGINNIQITKTYIYDLWRWIHENGIPAIKQNNIYQQQILKLNNNDNIDKINELKQMINNLQIENKKWRDIINKRYEKHQKDIESLNNKDNKINKLNLEIQKYKQNETILKYIKNNMIHKKNQNDKDYDNLFVLCLISMIFGYLIGNQIKRKYIKLISLTNGGIVIISFLAYKNFVKYYYWKKIFSLSIGCLIGFSVAFKSKK